MSDRDLMQQALDALTTYDGTNGESKRKRVLAALRERLAQPVQEPVDSPEKAGAYMDARLWEFIDMAAAWPEAKTDTRTWDHVLVYAPKQLEQEPVAWITDGGNGELWWYQSSKFDEEGNLIGYNPDDVPLYTAPPKREWVGLTDEEIWKCNKASGSAVEFHICYAHQNLEDFAESIEAKLKEKNT